MTTTTEQVLEFAPFRLLPGRRVLLEGEKAVRLGSRALEILIVLAEHPGALVSKDELIARVWPDTVVEEGNLRVHVAALRKVLGDGRDGKRFVVNVPGRGYSFVAPVQSQSELRGPAPPDAAPAPEPGHNLPAPLTRMIGRGDTVAATAAQLAQRRFVTIVGPGGIGKTTVALAVADSTVGSYEQGARFVDFSALAEQSQAPRALAAALGLMVASGDSLPALSAFLRDMRVLLVLDGCELVITAAAALAEHVLRAGPGVHVLATSREPLRAEGEQVQRLAPLAVPASSIGLTAAEAMSFPAVQLFVERAAANLDAFQMSDAEAPTVAEICRRLDGIPLAIELGAGRIDVFGIGGLATVLDDRFRLLTRGRRTALPRHQTLGATLDWSYELLAERERLALRRLGVFVGSFDPDSATAVVADAELQQPEVAELIANLAEKSMVAVDVGGAAMSYRLLDTTRAYALGKLGESGERAAIARRHGEHYRALFLRAEAEAEVLPAGRWLARYGGQIDNVRAALDWAFSSDGDVALGVELTAAAIPLWIHLSLFDECLTRIEQALNRLVGEASRDERREMHLLSALGVALLYANRDVAATEVARGADRAGAWSRSLRIAERLNDVDHRLRGLWGLWIHHFNNGEHHEALAFARRFHQLAEEASEPADALVGDRMIAFSLQLLGDVAGARHHVERMISSYVAPPDRSHILRYQFDQAIIARITLAQTLWLQGWPDRALRVVASNVEEALALGHTMSLCNALAQAACPVALLTGDLEAAERYVGILLEHAARRGLGPWHLWGRCYQGLLAARRGDIADGVSMFRAALGELPPNRFALRYTAFLGELAEILSQAGEHDESRAAIDRALDRSERHEELWCMPELLRIRAEIAWRRDPEPDVADVEGVLQQSLDWARRQQALSWELRTATSLARLWLSVGRREAARDLLQPVHARFSEGFQTADLKAARALLDTL
jgi:predicted ATPase/DNA-binding winged helix-turn-helix (wHTH) protein